jgi:hypothetical protein
MGAPELLGAGLRVLDEDADEGDALSLVPPAGLLEDGSLPSAVRSPRREEPDHDDLALEAPEVEGSPVEQWQRCHRKARVPGRGRRDGEAEEQPPEQGDEGSMAARAVHPHRRSRSQPGVSRTA